MNYNEFKKVLSVLEMTYNKKYSDTTKDVIYKLAGYEKLTLEQFERLILMVIRYNKKYSNELPLPADIFRYLDETNKYNNKTMQVYNIRNAIRENLLGMFGYSMIFDDPLVHLVYEVLGGNGRFGKLSEEGIENVLTYEVTEDLLNKINKTFDIPIFIGNTNSRMIRLIGSKDKILEWVDKVKREIERIKNDVVDIKLIGISKSGSGLVTKISDVVPRDLLGTQRDIERLYEYLGIKESI